MVRPMKKPGSRPDYMKKNYPGAGRHAFWGQMECGLVLSSVSPWEMVQKEKGVTRVGYVCRGFWVPPDHIGQDGSAACFG